MLDMIEELFESRNLYKVIGITPDNAENSGKLRAAYLKAALKYHPDKTQDGDDKEVQTRKFQLLTKIYDVLKDDDLRAEYNEAGEWPDSDDFQVAPSSHGRLDVITINEFKKAYQGSEEERSEVKRLYVEKEGNIFLIMDELFFAEILTDEERIESIIQDLIKNKDVTEIPQKASFQAYRKKRIQKAKREAAEAEEFMKEKGLTGSEDSLRQAILSRRAASDGAFLADLEKRYAKPEKQPRSKKPKRKWSPLLDINHDRNGFA